MWCVYFRLGLIVCLAASVISASNKPDGIYTLSVSKTYTAFSGDLFINYTIPSKISLPNAYIRISTGQGGKTTEITTRPLEMGKPEGQIRISCGVVEFSALHNVELYMYVGGPLLNSTTFMAVWPKFRLVLPSTHVAQTKPVTLLYTSEAICLSPVKRHSFYIDLKYTKDTDHIQPSVDFKNIVFDTKDSRKFETIDKPSGDLNFTCETFDAAGRYIAILRNDFNDSHIIVKSNILDVRWSTAYKISIYQQSVHPCTFPLSVKYTQPACPGNRDLLRMYYLRRTYTVSPVLPLDWIYVMEKPAFNNRSSVLFSCSAFDAKAIGYCFVYVTKAADGYITEQDHKCISNHPDTVLPIDGKWSAWSEWGVCSVSCGTGKQSRVRTCTDPKPAHGGRFCDGYPVEWKPCFRQCPDLAPDTPLNQLHLEGKCVCGCEMTNTTGEIIGTGRCKGLSQWIIAVPEGHIIQLTFQYFNLLLDEQWLKVRDSEPDGVLLFQSYGILKPTSIHSASNKLYVQFMTRYNGTLPLLYHHQQRIDRNLYNSQLANHLNAYGFIASYLTQAGDNSSIIMLPIVPKSDTSIWESTVTIAGISLCLTVIFILCVLAVYHRFFYKKKHKYAMAAHEETPTHIAKSTSMHSTPSHHSALSGGVEIDCDMERPLTGSGTKKENGGRISRGSSISSNRSNGLKIKVKASIEKSPKLGSKQYSPMPSPHVHSIKGDGCEKQSLFNTSPLLNRKPRSPKIHPSPRFKHSSKAKTPTSPSDTKYDLLIKRRRSKSEKTEKEVEERIIPGADNTPVADENTFFAVKKDESPAVLTPTDSKHICVQMETLDSKKTDISLPSVSRAEETRNPASGASDESSSPDNNEQTTSFISDKRPPRPTSLTNIHNKFPSSSSVSSDKRRKFGDRNKGLPQPDGESPKSSVTQSSKTSTPRSVHSSKSKLTLSPTRSITSDNLEMEYDDFIDYDDPLSYFDPEELEKLKWKGVEKISPKTKDEDD